MEAARADPLAELLDSWTVAELDKPRIEAPEGVSKFWGVYLVGSWTFMRESSFSAARTI